MDGGCSGPRLEGFHLGSGGDLTGDTFRVVRYARQVQGYHGWTCGLENRNPVVVDTPELVNHGGVSCVLR